MKKVAVVLALVGLFVAPTHAEQKKSYYSGSECVDEFVKGIIAGAVATLGLEAAREYILPDMGSFKLYDNYGICRDRLEGEGRVALAAIGFVGTEKLVTGNVPAVTFKRTGAQMSGIIIGAMLANYASKLAS